MNFFTLIAGGLFGLILPAMCLSLLLKSKHLIVSSFITSYLVIFHAVFWPGIFGVPLSFRNLMIIFCVLSGGLVVMCIRRRSWDSLTATRSPPKLTAAQSIPGVLIFMMSALFIARYIAQPLNGWDTSFRWNFLAAKLLQLKTFSFYPPVTSEHFEHYFSVDGIPPVCQFAYFWLYASYGKVTPVLTSILVIPQYLLSMYLCYKIAETLFPKATGIFAATIFCCTPLIFWAVFMGQETGLTTLSFLAMTYFLLLADNDDGTIIIAGFATALGALAREYGCIFMLYGLLICARKRMSLKRMAWYSLTVLGVASPWYIRNWVVTGNPFYSNSVGGLFPVNRIHVEILDFFSAIFSFITNWQFMFTTLGKSLVMYALPVTVVGIIGCCLFFRRVPYLVIGAVMLTCIWFYSVGQTIGGLLYSMRVLAPVFAILSVLGGAVLQRLSQRTVARTVIVVGLLLVGFLGFFQNLVVPKIPWEIPIREWRATGFSPQNPDSVFQELQPLFSPGDRILSDHAYAYVALSSENLSLIPIWSPDLEYTFSEELSPSRILRKLRQQNISYMLLSARGRLFYLETYPFYQSCFQHLTPLKYVPHSYVLFSLDVPKL